MVAVNSRVLPLSAGLSIWIVALAAVASTAFGADLSCPAVPAGEIPAANALKYPMISDRYRVQYSFDSGRNWIDAAVYISYYGATPASPWLPASKYALPYQARSSSTSAITPAWETSMSFVSIPVPDIIQPESVDIRVTNLLTDFEPGDTVSVRPTAKGISASVGSGIAGIRKAFPRGGDQFVLWWTRGGIGGRVEGLAFFLNPDSLYVAPSGQNVLNVQSALELTRPIPSNIDTLNFESAISVISTQQPPGTPFMPGADVLVVPAQIRNIYLGENAWVQGKLLFEESGKGDFRHLYGPGVLDVSRFDYNRRHCSDANGYPAISFQPLPAGSPGIRDQYLIEGIIISDTNFYATDALDNTTVTNVKTLGWNSNNDGLEPRNMSRVSDVFVRSGDDSLKVWGSYSNVTNATVWQNYNGGVVNLGWSDNSPGENSLIDGVYVVNTDWATPLATTDPTQADKKCVPAVPPPGTTCNHPIDDLNNAVIASEMFPGTLFGLIQPSLYRNFYLENDSPPQVLFSLKIVPPRTGVPADASIDLKTPSVLNLNIEGVHSPPSNVESFVGLQTLPTGYTFDSQVPPLFPATLPYPLRGSMKIGLYDVEITGSTPPILNGGDARTAGKIRTETSKKDVDVDVTYGVKLPQPTGPQWYSAWAAPQGYRIPAKMDGTSVRMIVRPSISGTMVRVKIENTVGSKAVEFGAAFIGELPPVATDSTPPAGPLARNTQLFFNGSPNLVLAPGKGAYSDPLPFNVSTFGLYAVSLDVTMAPDVSSHLLGHVTNYMNKEGGKAGQAGATGFTHIPNDPNPNTTGNPTKDDTYPVYWVAGLDVFSASASGAIVALGDSITDGQCSATLPPSGTPPTSAVQPDQYLSWPDLLARRLSGSKAVVNEGIAGNQISGGVGDAVGQPVLVRIANDVLGRSGATHVIFLEGTNDIFAANPTPADVDAEVAKLKAADQRIIDDAHLIGLNIIGATILPRGADKNWTAPMESVRSKLNAWITSTAPFDNHIDFEALMQNPPDLTTPLPSITPKFRCFDDDGVHPNALGYQAMANSINLKLFDSPLRAR